MRSIRFSPPLSALSAALLAAALAAGCGGGNNEDPAPIRVPLLQDLSDAALEAATGPWARALEVDSVAVDLSALSSPLPADLENVELHVAEAADGASAHLLLAAGEDSRLLRLTGLPDAPRAEEQTRIPAARDLQRSTDSVYVLSASTLREVFSGTALEDRSIPLPTRKARSFALVWPYAYVAAAEDGLLIVDLSLSEPADVVVNTATAFSVEDVAAAGDFLYLAEGASGLGLLRISEGNIAVNEGNFFPTVDCLLSGATQAVEVLARNSLHYLYLEQSEGAPGVAIFNETPAFIGCQPLSLELRGLQLAADGDEAWLGGHCCGGVYALAPLDSLFVSLEVPGLLAPGPQAPAAPGRLYSYGAADEVRLQTLRFTTVSRTAADVAVAASGFALHLAGENAHIVHAQGAVQAPIFATDTRRAVERLSFGRLGAVAFAGPQTPTLMYAGFENDARIELWRFTTTSYVIDSTSAEFISQSTTNAAVAGGVRALLLAAGSLFVADATGHVQVLHDADAETLRSFALTEACGLNPEQGAAAPCALLSSPVTALAHHAAHLYAGTADGRIHALQAGDLTAVATLRAGVPTMYERGVAQILPHGDYAYVAAYGAGVRVLNIQDPAAPHWEPAVLAPAPAAFGVALWSGEGGALLYVAAGSAVEVYDLSDPAAPARLPQLRAPGFAFTVKATADALHILERHGWRDYYRVVRPRPQP